MSSSNSMIRLLNLMSLLREESVHGAISHQDQQMLAYIYEQNAMQNCVTVSDLVVSRFFGTAPTVQRHVNKMVEIGFLVYSKSLLDRRKQCLHLSDAALKYFQDLSNCLPVIEAKA